MNKARNKYSSSSTRSTMLPSACMPSVLLTIKRLAKTLFPKYSPPYGTNMDNFEIDPKTILGYLKMCVRNNCLNYLKHQEYEWNYAEVVKKKTPVYETEPDSVYTLDEMYRMLYGTLNKLPESYRIVFIESFFKGKTHTEIAEELNLSVKSVNRYKQKTLEFLRNELKEYMPLLLLFIPR